MLPAEQYRRDGSKQIPGLSLIPSYRFSSAYFLVTRHRSDMS
ncbi:rho operon leader peptide [Kosakonia radicincitans]|nr:rho operon leader peptide [Kosakonia radicincitans]